MFTQGVAVVFHLETKRLLNRQTQFQRIHRIQPQAFVAKQRCFAVDVGRGDVFQPQAVDNQYFNLLLQVVHVWASRLK